MTDNDDVPADGTVAGTVNDAAALRLRAELTIARTGERRKAVVPVEHDDHTRLIHELQVHQIELELQNEQLRVSRDETESLRARYTDLYEFAPNGYVTVGTDGTMAESNHKAAQLLGREYGTLRDKRLGTFIADADRKTFNDFLEKLFADDESSTCEVSLGNDVAAAIIVAIEGVRSADRVECRLSLTDITQRHRAESALRLRDRAIRAVTQGILITDPNQPGHPIVYANPGFEQLTGYTALEVVGRNCRFLQGPSTDPAAVRTLRAAIEGERPCSVELLNYRKDGSAFRNALFVTPVRDDRGSLVQYIGVLVDVTAQRETERALQQAQRLEIVGRLAGGVAHDFNSLLTVINGNAGLLLSDVDSSDPKYDLVRAINVAGERAASLTHKLLAFSRSQMLDPTVLDVSAAITGLAGSVRRLLGPDVELKLELDAHPIYVRVDASQLGQVLVNLAGNARDAMQERGRLIIRTSRVLIAAPLRVGHEEILPGAYALVSVSDNGAGMDAATAARVFDPFFSTKGVGKGSGLGLAMVYGLVKQSAGYVSVDSISGQGSAFHIYLPSVAAPVLAPADEHSRTGTLSNETIVLVADADASTQQLTRAVLSQQGYELILCDSVALAMESIASHSGAIDLLIVPQDGDDGMLLDLLAQARDLRPGLHTILLSRDSSASSEGSENLTRLAKPFSPIALTRCVRAVLDAAHSED